MRTNRFLAAAAASVIAATSLVACGSESDSSNSSGDTTTVKIGTTDADLKAWSVFEAVSYTHLTLPTIYSV